MSGGGKSPRKGYWPYVLLLLFCATALSYHVRSTFAVLNSPVQVRDPFGGIIAIAMRVARPLPEASSAGLRAGDKLLSVNGVPFRGVGDYYEALQHAKPGDLLQLQVKADNSPPGDVVIKLRPRFTTPLRASDSSLAIFLVLVSWFSIALGIWITAVRVRDIRAWMILLVLAGLAVQFDNVRPYYGYADFLRPITVGWQNFISNTWSIPLLLFGIYFPDRLALDRRFPWLKWLIITPLLLLLSRNAIFLMIAVGHADAAQAFRRVFSFNYAKEPFDITNFILLFACLAYRTVTAAGRDQRRRLLFLDAGAAIALLPYFSYYCLALVFHVAPPRWYSITTLPLLYVFPLTMAYVIVVHRAMDISVVIRTGVRYLLASKGVRALQIILSIVVIATAASVAFGSATNLTRIVIVAIAIAAMILLGRFAERARQWVDRKFFREAYDGESILSDLAGKVRSVVEIGPLFEMVATRIAESLHIDRIAVMLAEDGGFRPAYALGYSGIPDVRIPEDGRTAQRLRSEQSVMVDTAAEKENSDSDSIALERLRPELLLPLSLNEKVLGILSLGPKRSEAPFTRSDVRLLSSVATQTALALENSRLVAEVKAEVAQRERMNRELEIAREVQERLFPQTIPVVPGIDLSGFCRPALGVGGDYYDYFSLANGELCIAVGDVSGKGIPASLLMASLRASLRARTMSVEPDLASLMGNINKLVYESSAVNKYATFFYGQYSPESRVLRYVNAGHEPPLVFRDGELIPLDTGGPVVGLLPMARFEQGCIQLQSGDLLLAFTDGISEAMNPQDEEWGVEKLICCVRGCGDIPAQDLIRRIMCAADAFAAGAKQHDDMTIVAARIQ